MSVILQRMRWWHVAPVRDIETQLFPGDAWSEEQFWQELAQPTRRYLVACDGDDVVGYAGAFVMPPDGDIQTVGVRGDRQGRGIARALVTTLIDTIEDEGATHTMLEVRADNAPALALYESLGFVRLSTRRRYYPDGADAIIMRRSRAEAREVVLGDR